MAEKYPIVDLFSKVSLSHSERFWLTFVQAYVRAIMMYEHDQGLIEEYNRLIGGDV